MVHQFLQEAKFMFEDDDIYDQFRQDFVAHDSSALDRLNMLVDDDELVDSIRRLSVLRLNR